MAGGFFGPAQRSGRPGLQHVEIPFGVQAVLPLLVEDGLKAPADQPDPLGGDWLVLRPEAADPSSGRGIAFQRAEDYVPPVWSAGEEPTEPSRQRQMVHLDMSVPDVDSLTRQRDRATALGAAILFDRSDDEAEPLYVFADPDGHPFCIFVA